MLTTDFINLNYFVVLIGLCVSQNEQKTDLKPIAPDLSHLISIWPDLRPNLTYLLMIIDTPREVNNFSVTLQ